MSLPANITAIRSLIDYLEPNMPDFDLDNMFEEWPDANMEMIYPAMSFISQPIEFIPHPPQAQRILDGDAENTLNVLYEVGQYNLRIQVDIWCGNKEDRGIFLEQFMDAFNRQFIDDDAPMGATVTMTDYYNSLARYEMIGYNYPDDSNSSQAGDRRVKIDLVANFRRVREVVRSKMANIVLQDEISSDVEINN